eukprot:CAMPEP_0114137030 /NCGR_PEP_ID=MMETSP0043_2-20121206/15558_1 /TAXON_ID=464988 /ORGANISM="Hemiselmis andersenii, Strain CCMP644" /LENGTH=49 /DNA_ID=CAMNT_0001230879 /DNA_START=18 /DNA_END=167 /DNA_ORIENTATION=+
MLSQLFNAASNDTLSVSLGLRDHKSNAKGITATPDRSITTAYTTAGLLN